MWDDSLSHPSSQPIGDARAKSSAPNNQDAEMTDASDAAEAKKRGRGEGACVKPPPAKLRAAILRSQRQSRSRLHRPLLNRPGRMTAPTGAHAWLSWLLTLLLCAVAAAVCCCCCGDARFSSACRRATRVAPVAVSARRATCFAVGGPAAAGRKDEWRRHCCWLLPDLRRLPRKRAPVIQ